MTTAFILTTSLFNAVLLLVALALLQKVRDERMAHTASRDGSGHKASPDTAEDTPVGAPTYGVHHPSREALDAAEDARQIRLRREHRKYNGL